MRVMKDVGPQQRFHLTASRDHTINIGKGGAVNQIALKGCAGTGPHDRYRRAGWRPQLEDALPVVDGPASLSAKPLARRERSAGHYSDEDNVGARLAIAVESAAHEPASHYTVYPIYGIDQSGQSLPPDKRHRGR